MMSGTCLGISELWRIQLPNFLSMLKFTSSFPSSILPEHVSIVRWRSPSVHRYSILAPAVFRDFMADQEHEAGEVASMSNTMTISLEQ